MAQSNDHGHAHNHSHGAESSHPAVAIQRQPHPRQHQHRSGSATAFRWSVILNSGLSALQLAIGFGFGSLALIGDAVHNLGDVAGLLLGWGAERLSSRAPNEKFTYGFGRSTQLASLANAVLILMASAVVLMEGIKRLGASTEVISTPVAWAAAPRGSPTGAGQPDHVRSRSIPDRLHRAGQAPATVCRRPVKSCPKVRPYRPLSSRKFSRSATRLE